LSAELENPCASWRRRVSGWHRRTKELEATVTAVYHSADQPPTEAEIEIRVNAARAAFPLLAMNADLSDRGRVSLRKRLLVHRHDHKKSTRGMPEDSPGRAALLADPVALAVGPVPVLELADVKAPPNLREPWIQAAALVAVEAALLPADKARSSADPGKHLASRDVRRALKDIRFELGRRRVDLRLPTSPRTL
jgi:hypothetical protein